MLHEETKMVIKQALQMLGILLCVVLLVSICSLEPSRTRSDVKKYSKQLDGMCKGKNTHFYTERELRRAVKEVYGY